jgi:hypothetical protein
MKRRDMGGGLRQMASGKYKVRGRQGRPRHLPSQLSGHRAG